jgi:hypothetical protein
LYQVFKLIAYAPTLPPPLAPSTCRVVPALVAASPMVPANAIPVQRKQRPVSAVM